jgi:hypothetical protein
MAKKIHTGEMPGDAASAAITPKGDGTNPLGPTPPKSRPAAHPPSLMAILAADNGPQTVQVAIAGSSTTLSVGGTVQLSALSRDDEGGTNPTPTVTWSSGNPSVATVDSNGLVTAVAAGQASIYATVDGVLSLNDFVVAVVPSGATITVSSGNGQTVVVGKNGADLAVLVEQGGQPLAGEVVDWASDDEGLLIVSSSVTNASGIASTPFPVTGISGSASVTASLPRFPTATVATFTVTKQAGRIVTLEADTDTEGQSATTATAVAVDPAVYGYDVYGNRVIAGKNVLFTVVGGGGSVVGGTANTDANGRAVVTSWTLGPVAGLNTIRAEAEGIASVDITANGTAPEGAATIALDSGDAQSEPPTTVLSPLVVYCGTSLANPAEGVTVTFTVLSGDCSLSASTAVTAANGKCSVVPTLGTTAGAVVVQAAAGGLSGSPITFNLTIEPGTATKVAFTIQPSATATVGQAFQQQPRMQMQDQWDNDVALAGIPLTVSVSSGVGTLIGTTSYVTNASGFANGSGLGITGSTGAHAITVAAGGYTSGVSNTITVGAVQPHHLAFGQQPPSSVPSGNLLSPPVTVRILDANNTLVTTATNEITLAVSTGGTITGTLTVVAVNGIATFPDITLAGTVSSSYTLTATATGLISATSNAVTIAAAGTTNPNKPSTCVTRRVLETFDVLPPNHPSSSPSGYKFTSGRTRATIVTDTSAPKSPTKVLRVYYPPTHSGGSAPINLTCPVAPRSEAYYHVTFRPGPVWSNQGNAGTKHIFVSQVSGLTNHFINFCMGGGLNGGACGGVWGYTSQGTTISYPPQSGTTMRPGTLDTWWDMESYHKNISTGATGIRQAWRNGNLFADYSNVLYSDTGETLNIFNTAFFSSTYGGGPNSPPGVVGTGANGSFVRSDGVAGTVAGQVFTRTSGTWVVDAEDAGYWHFVTAAGVIKGPYVVESNTTNSLTFLAGDDISGAVVGYPTPNEVFKDSFIGRTVYFRSPTLNQNDGITGGLTGDGLYPLIHTATITGITTTTLPRDTVTFSGDATGGDWMFGLFQMSGPPITPQTMPLYWDIDHIEVWTN